MENNHIIYLITDIGGFLFSPTLPSLATIHSKVCGFIGFQACLLHTWPVHLHIFWVTTFSNGHLRNQRVHRFIFQKQGVERFSCTIILVKP